MKSSQFSRRKLLCLSFLIPFLGYTLVMLVSRYSPFGSSSILYSDMYHQYYPFFVEFRRTLREGHSLLYNWNLGMGLDYLALIAYYLASPLNLLSVLVPENMLLGFFSMLVPVRLGLAGLFFALFLDKIFHKDDLGLPLFAACYALCAWALGYQWNIMWLDTFALLPLVMLGMVKLLQQRRFVLYTLTLFLSVASNYYIGLFTCIFVGLSFICFEICYGRSFRRFLADLGLMFLFSGLAIAMTGFLEWPAYVALKNTQSSVNQFPTTFSLNIAGENTWLGLLDAMRQVAGNTAGGLSPTFKEGLPNLYCGILPVMFTIQFFATGKVKLREKLCTLSLLVFFMLSFIIRQLDYIWHGFHFTNMIPYRFSFLFSFVVLVTGYRGYLQLDQCPRWRAALSVVGFLALAACSNDRLEPVFLVYNLVFCAIYAYLLLGRKRQKKEKIQEEDGITVRLLALSEGDQAWNRKLASLLLAAMALELVCALVNFGVNFGGTSITNYPSGKEDTADVIDYMQELEQDNLFYRAEFTHTQTLNDDALNGFSGITMFSSSVNVRVTKFMAALGFGAKPTYNRYSFEEASPVADLFLNLKYMISRDGNLLEENLFQPVYNMGNVTLLENTAYLPLGFMVKPELTALDSEDADAGSFSYLNRLFRLATGMETPVYTELTEVYSVTADEGISPSQRGSSGYCSYSSTEAGDLTISFTVPRDGAVCLDLSASKRNSLTVCRNGESLISESLSLDQMLEVGQCNAGDLIEVVFHCNADEDGRIELSAAVLDEDVFRQGAAILGSSTLELDSFADTRVEGSVTCLESGLLYTSIPDDGNWIVTVDGAETEHVLIGGAMIGVPLTAGAHQVTFTYRNEAFRLGLMVSLAALAVFLGITALAYWPRKRGKYQGK